MNPKVWHIDVAGEHAWLLNEDDQRVAEAHPHHGDPARSAPEIERLHALALAQMAGMSGLTVTQLLETPAAKLEAFEAMRGALRELKDAVSSRENTMGDPCDLLVAQDQVRRTLQKASAALALAHTAIA